MSAFATAAAARRCFSMCSGEMMTHTGRQRTASFRASCLDEQAVPRAHPLFNMTLMS